MHQNVIKLYDENKNVEMTDFKVELFLNSGYKFNYLNWGFKKSANVVI